MDNGERDSGYVYNPYAKTVLQTNTPGRFARKKSVNVPLWRMPL